MEAYRAGHIVGQAIVGLVCGALLLVAVAMAASVVDRADVPVEAVSATVVVVALGAAALVGLGVIATALSKNRDILFLSTASAVLILLTIAGLFSIGMLILPFAVGSIYLLVRRAAGRNGLVPSVLAGVSIAVGMALLLVIWVQPPLVECSPSGASTSSRPWWNTGGSSGSGVQSNATNSRGSIDTPNGRYVFSCRGGDLIRFRRIGGS